jgi:hypothetical protein
MVKHSQILSGRTIGRSGDTVWGLYRAQGDKEHGFLGSASKLRSTVSPDLASKPVATILVFWPQNYSLGFLGLGLKASSCSFVIWSTKSPRRFFSLDLKTKWEEVCRFAAQNQ